MTETQEVIGFNGANLKGAKLNRTTMLVPRMRTSILRDVDLTDSVLERPVLRGTDLRGAIPANSGTLARVCPAWCLTSPSTRVMPLCLDKSC